MGYDFAGARGFFCPDVADGERVTDWANLGGASVEDPAGLSRVARALSLPRVRSHSRCVSRWLRTEAQYAFSDDAHDETTRTLMEPKSIRAPSTLIYSTALIRDATEAKQSGTELSEIDSYLLPPALLQHYINERKPRPPPDTQTEGQAEGGRGQRPPKEQADDAPVEPPSFAPLNVSWSDFVDVNTANGYSVTKRTAPPPPASAQKQQRKKRKGVTDAQADTDTAGEGAEAGAEGAEEVFEVERLLKKRVRKGNEAEYLVQWVGYPDAADTTWETAENLANATALVAAFERDETKQSSKEQTQGKTSPPSRRRSNRASMTAASAVAAAAAAASAAAATAAEDGSESDEYNLSQDTDFSQSQSQSESQSRHSRAQAKRGIDSRSSKRLQTLVHELSGDSVTAGKVLSGALPSNDPGVLSKRWTRAQDSKLLAVVAGKRSVKAVLWTEASAETGKSVADCKARRAFLQQTESQS